MTKIQTPAPPSTPSAETPTPISTRQSHLNQPSPTPPFHPTIHHNPYQPSSDDDDEKICLLLSTFSKVEWHFRLRAHMLRAHRPGDKCRLLDESGARFVEFGPWVDFKPWVGFEQITGAECGGAAEELREVGLVIEMLRREAGGMRAWMGGLSSLSPDFSAIESDAIDLNDQQLGHLQRRDRNHGGMAPGDFDICTTDHQEFDHYAFWDPPCPDRQVIESERRQLGRDLATQLAEELGIEDLDSVFDPDPEFTNAHTPEDPAPRAKWFSSTSRGFPSHYDRHRHPTLFAKRRIAARERIITEMTRRMEEKEAREKASINSDLRWCVSKESDSEDVDLMKRAIAALTGMIKERQTPPVYGAEKLGF